MRLERKIALITGAGSGIGEASARLFSENGATVLMVDHDETNGRRVTEGLRDATFYRADVSEADDVQGVFAHIEKTYGRLDILFNNAAVVPEEPPLADLEEAQFDKVISVNLKGTWLCMKYAVPLMLAHGSGSIINTASIGGLIGNARQSAYGAAKGGVIQLTRNCAADYADRNIRANAICPGTILTPLSFGRRPGKTENEIRREFAGRQPLPRAGMPLDVANLALWLASDESVFVTAQHFVIDGGSIGIRRPVSQTSINESSS